MLRPKQLRFDFVGSRFHSVSHGKELALPPCASLPGISWAMALTDRSAVADSLDECAHACAAERVPETHPEVVLYRRRYCTRCIPVGRSVEAIASTCCPIVAPRRTDFNQICAILGGSDSHVRRCRRVVRNKVVAVMKWSVSGFTRFRTVTMSGVCTIWGVLLTSICWYSSENAGTE